MPGPASRAHPVSTRVREEVYSALRERAESGGTTFSSFISLLLEESVAKTVGSEVKPVPPSIPTDQLQPILDRLQNLEAWAQFTFAIAVKGPNWSIDTLPCPRCGQLGLEYMEFEVGGAPGSAFVCMTSPCEWNVKLEAPDVLGAGSAPGQPTGQGG